MRNAFEDIIAFVGGWLRGDWLFFDEVLAGGASSRYAAPTTLPAMPASHANSTRRQNRRRDFV